MSASTPYNKRAKVGLHETEVQSYKRLLNDVFLNYSKTSRPVKEEKNVLQVKMSMGLNQILELVNHYIYVYFKLQLRNNLLLL